MRRSVKIGRDVCRDLANCGCAVSQELFPTDYSSRAPSQGLYTRAESRIAMPMQVVTKRQIADPGGHRVARGRRHEGQDIFDLKEHDLAATTKGFIYKIGEEQPRRSNGISDWFWWTRFTNAHLDCMRRVWKSAIAFRHAQCWVTWNNWKRQGTPPHLHFGVYTLQERSSAPTAN